MRTSPFIAIVEHLGSESIVTVLVLTNAADQVFYPGVDELI